MDKIILWLKYNCPLFWQILNKKAKKKIPDGIMEFLSSCYVSEIENGKKIFSIIETYLKTLTDKIGINDIADKYSGRLSTVSSEKKLSEIFSEISVCATISKISSAILLEPVSREKKHSDFKALIDNYEIYGEVKRYEDKKYLGRKGRSILTTDDSKTKQKTHKPRYFELCSKLTKKGEEVYKQLPTDSISIVFLFHASYGETVNYIKQLLFGESNFWNKNENLILEPNSLFSKVEWENISAVCLCKLGENESVEFYEIFRNPNANNRLPDIIVEKLRTCALTRRSS